MVSIVLVTYNRAQRLQLSIQDILDQSFTEFELIICDDCSTDETRDICLDFASRDKRIRYFRQAANRRMPANCNFGIRQAKYDYVAILHDGDRFRPDLIEQWYTAISTNDNVGFVFNSIAETDGDENVVNCFREFPEGIVDKDLLLKSIFFRRPHFDSPVWGETMFRKDLVVKYGYMKKEYGFYADVDLWMELLHDHDAYYCADTLMSGPVKALQPQLFENDIIKFNVYILSMHLKHRTKAFKAHAGQLTRELAIFYVHAMFHISYCLLLVVKNFTFHYFMQSRKYLQRHAFLLFPWGIFLFLYPILRLLSFSFKWAKDRFVGENKSWPFPSS